MKVDADATHASENDNSARSLDKAVSWCLSASVTLWRFRATLVTVVVRWTKSREMPLPPLEAMVGLVVVGGSSTLMTGRAWSGCFLWAIFGHM